MARKPPANQSTFTKTSRRSFIGQSAALGMGVWTGSQTSLARSEDSPLQSLTAVGIGIGGKGSSDISHIAGLGVKIVGLCDVDGQRLTKKGREFPDADQFQDFHEMLDKLGDKVDVVTVSTPDHTHAVAAVKAMQMGKHVYCQKPLTYSIQEARIMRETAQKMGVITQMGNQGTSENGLREAVEVVQSGALGDVKEIHIWSNRPVWAQGMGRPVGEEKIPDDLNWDGWIGPAPMRPYIGGRTYHPWSWRGWVDFGTGALGDMACHTTNMPVMALELWDPIAVTCLENPGLVDNETYPMNSVLKYEFPARNGLPARHFYWYDGGNLPPDEVLNQLPKSFQKKIADQKAGGNKTSGAVIVGTNGILFSPDDYGSKYYLLPKEQFADFEKPAQSLPRNPYQGNTDQRQKWEFVSKIRGEYDPGPMSHFGYAGRLTETILVGNLALRAEVGQRIEWDAERLMSTNVPAVNQFVNREYRDGWEIGGHSSVARV